MWCQAYHICTTATTSSPPILPQVAPGKVDPRTSEVFGRGLYEGVAGIQCTFTIQSKDAYGNRCFRPSTKFMVHLKPLQSLVSELDAYMRKCDCLAQIVDNEDGSYGVSYSVDFAGFYAVEVGGGGVAGGYGDLRSGEGRYCARLALMSSLLAWVDSLSL